MSATAKDQWSATASKYSSVGVIMQRSAPLRTLLTNTNTFSPFSTATSILDNGCGPGIATTALIETYGPVLPANCKLTAADFSEGMVAAAATRRDVDYASDPTWKRVRTVVQDATDMQDFKEGEFSHVVANMVYFLTPEPSKCLSESYRVLGRGGVLSCTSIESAEWITALNEHLKVRPDLEGIRIPEEWRDIGKLKGLMEAAGFKDVIVERATMVAPLETYESHIESMFDMAFMKGKKEQFSNEEWERAFALMKAKFAEFCPTEPGELKGSILVATGRK